ncbi:MAG: hypothetical protein JWQ29_1107 [Phenylobacterium sp.]|nr:hypothetical protein [Phenylobacterium sp.]
MGHLNVGFYVAKAMEGLIGLAAELGMPGAFSPQAQATLVVRDQHIRFMKEARPGSPLTMTGGVVAWGETDARLLLLLRHRTGEIAAVFQTMVTHATAREARPFAWSERVRARALALTMEVPEEARPRSIGLEPVESKASLERALELGLKRTALGAITPADCDAFGRMRTELMMARISDGVPHVFDTRPGAVENGGRTGGAALEYRLIHLAWPRAGDRIEMRSGSAGGDARFRKLVHWLLDPETGAPWGVAEAMAVSFDLETRKLITLTDEALAQANATAVPGLTL